MNKSGQRPDTGKGKTVKEQRKAFSKETILPLILRCHCLSAVYAVIQEFKVPTFCENCFKNHNNEDNRPEFYPAIKSSCTGSHDLLLCRNHFEG